MAIMVILMFLDTDIQTALIASLGATSFTVFCSPHHFVSSPRTVLGGYFVGILTGVVYSMFISQYLPYIAAPSLSVGTAIFLMVATNTEHPPAAGIALGLTLNPWNAKTLLFISAAVVMMSVLKGLLKPVMKNLIGEVYTKRSDMTLDSPAFEDMQPLPVKYTADGECISPPLDIIKPPSGTKSYALVFTDYDGVMGIKDHWALWNIPPDIESIGEGETPPSVSGRNDFNNTCYVGPAHPGGTHTYVFKIYALDQMLDLKEGSRKKYLERKMQGHIIDKAVLRCTYTRNI